VRLKHIAFVITFILITFANVWSLPPLKSIEKLRPKGSERTYLIKYKDEQAGVLVSKFDGTAKFEGVNCYRFSENYNLNLTPYDVDYAITTINKHYVNKKGYYVGDDMSINANNQTQKLYLYNKDENLSGHFKRGETIEEISRPLEKNILALDNMMIDQIEIFLAFHNVYTGDTIYDSVFVPQLQTIMPVKVAVVGFEWTRYGELFDSAYVCHFLQPNDQIVYYTKSRKVIRIDQEQQDLHIHLYETELDRTAPKVQAFTFSDFIQRLPLNVTYLIFAIIFSSMFLPKYHKTAAIYIAFVLGAAMLFIVKETLFPLQKWFGEQYLIPGIKAGGSLYYYAIFPSLFSGLFQEAAKMIPLLIVYLWKKPRQEFSITLGAFCGLGLGFVMAGWFTGAAYQAGGLKIISLAVFGQIIMILFHGVAGAAFGYGLNRGIKYIGIIWPATVLIHAFSEYLLVFTQTKALDMSVYGFLRILICLMYLLVIYILIKKGR